LPAGWDQAEVKRLPIGGRFVDLLFKQSSRVLTVSIESKDNGQIKLGSPLAGTKTLSAEKIEIPRPAVEVGSAFVQPIPGSRTEEMRVLREEYAPRQLTLTLEGMAGTEASLPVFKNDAKVKLTATGADLTAAGDGQPEAMSLHFPAGQGWKTITVTLAW
jgi:hypothetical protein